MASTYDSAGLEVAQGLVTVSQVLAAAVGVEATVELICVSAVRQVPGCEMAGVLMVNAGDVRSMGATSDVAERMGRMQIEEHQGPCIDALYRGEVVVVDDLATDERWVCGPEASVATGVHSVLAVGLRSEDRTIGALTLYSCAPRAFDEGSVTPRLAALFGSQAAIALAGAQTVEGLQCALDTRGMISTAMGILMARQQINRDRAFDVLRRASQRENVKLRDIAARIVAEAEEASSGS